MSARIYQNPKHAMQSGKAHTDEWVLEFEPSQARFADPLMGWTGTGDTQAQIKLTFPSKDAARSYAEKCGIPARVIATPPNRLKLQAYADNFR
jgi:hypothetical protein